MAEGSPHAYEWVELTKLRPLGEDALALLPVVVDGVNSAISMASTVT